MPGGDRLRKGPGRPERPAPTVVGLTRADRAWLLLGGPALGALLGLALPPVGRWVAQLRWAPLQGPLEVVGGVAAGWSALAGGLLGLGGGALLAALALKVTLGDAGIDVDWEGRAATLPRAEVAAGFLDGRELVILDHASRQLLRRRCDASGAELAAAFAAHGYRWLPEDPYAALYRRWVPDAPDLPAAANAVLKAREVALRKKSESDAAEELRDEVQKLGFVVRDESTRQYWRPLVRP